MKFNVKALSLTAGILWGLTIFLATLWLLVFGYNGHFISGPRPLLLRLHILRRRGFYRAHLGVRRRGHLWCDLRVVVQHVGGLKRHHAVGLSANAPAAAGPT